MSTWYILANLDLKEFLCSGCVGSGIHQYAYEFGPIGKLLPTLLMYDYKEEQYSLQDMQDPDWSAQGHWGGGCHIKLIDEHDKLYDESDEAGTDWMNITPHTVIECNQYANDDDKFKLRICNSHHDKSSEYWRQKLAGDNKK